MSGPRKARKPKRLRRSDGCLAFDGTNDKVIIPLNSTAWPSTGDFSICFWARAANMTAYDWFFSQSTSKNDATSMGWQLGDKFTFQIKVSGSAIITLTSDAQTALTNDEWYHFAIVADRSSASNSKIYINGSALGMETQTMDSSTDININADFEIAKNMATSSPAGNKEMMCSEFSIFNGALVLKDIQKMYSSKGRLDLTRGRYNTNLLCYYRLGGGVENLHGSVGALVVDGATSTFSHP